MTDTVNKAKNLEGIVIGISGNKTLKVLIQTQVRHPLYQKIIARHSKYLVHDEHNQAQIGSKVIIKQVSPISKHKAWALHQILEISART